MVLSSELESWLIDAETIGKNRASSIIATSPPPRNFPLYSNFSGIPLSSHSAAYAPTSYTHTA